MSWRKVLKVLARKSLGIRALRATAAMRIKLSSSRRRGDSLRSRLKVAGDLQHARLAICKSWRSAQLALAEKFRAWLKSKTDGIEIGPISIFQQTCIETCRKGLLRELNPGPLAP